MLNKKLSVEMDDIKDLIRIVTDYTRRNIPLIDLKSQHPNGNKELNLFMGIKNDSFMSDTEASRGIYGSPEVDFKFRMLKSRLNRKLLNHLFFIDYSILKMPKAYLLRQECQDYLHFSKSLLTVGEKKLATKLLFKTIDLATECEFTDLAIDGLKELRDIYTSDYRPKLFQNVKQQLEKFKTRLNEEERAYTIYYEATLKINSTINNRKKDLKYLTKSIRLLKNKCDKLQSYNIYEKYFKLKIQYFELDGNFNELLEYVAQLEQEFKMGHINENRFDPSIIWLAQLKAFLKVNRFEEGITLAEQKLIGMEPEDHLWLDVTEYLFLILMRMKEFSRAGVVLQKVFDNNVLNQKDEITQQKWDVYRSYAYYMTGNTRLIDGFNYQSFITDTPNYKKEMAGVHTARLFLQITASLQGDLSILHKKLDAIDDYIGKYLNNSFGKRTKLFHKLLQKVISNDRDHEAVILKSKYLEDKLKETNIIPDVFADIEVVLYEHLWESIQKKLLDMRKSIHDYSQS